jgi:hypothetical protein
MLMYSEKICVPKKEEEEKRKNEKTKGGTI